MRIAVIGSGISGNAAAWALSQAEIMNMSRPEVVMYESRERPGGHSHTIDIDYNGKTFPVDVGFIVYNELNYPDLVALFDHLGVETMQTSMSFGVSLNNGGLEWSGDSLNSIFAQRRNLISPSFLTMLRDIFRFNERARNDFQDGVLGDESLADYLKKHRFSKPFMEKYLAPMGAAIWSTPHADIFNFPAKSFIQFFNNHRLIHNRKQRPKWRTVVGGSRHYVKKIIEPFADNIRYKSKVIAVERRDGMVTVTDENGHKDRFDHVVLAGHSDQSLAILKDADSTEKKLLGDIGYRPNQVYLHRDAALMPRRKRVWSAWNYIETPHALQSETGVCVSYSMNELQNICKTTPVFVSLNPSTPPRDDLTFAATNFSHPQFDRKAIAAQKELNKIQGKGNVWYCGAWTGYGFHEDGLRSGLDVAEHLGARIPWRDYSDKNHMPQLEAAE